MLILTWLALGEGCIWIITDPNSDLVLNEDTQVNYSFANGRAFIQIGTGLFELQDDLLAYLSSQSSIIFIYRSSDIVGGPATYIGEVLLDKTEITKLLGASLYLAP